MVCFDKSFVKDSDLMENDKQKQSRALSVLLEAIEETNSNDILIGERKREIERLENKKEKINDVSITPFPLNTSV